ncbi:aldehyde dehydrogenase [Marasmius fiardii PR-910]|nr:aldehyde dehydrogenase [Marasmius fiardii PR-910]
MALTTFTLKLDTPAYRGTLSVDRRLFIGGSFVEPIKGGEIEVVNPSTTKPITSVYAGTAEDVDVAVAAAKKAFKNSWGLKVPGSERGRLLNKVADLLEANADEVAALEALNVGKPFANAKNMDLKFAISTLRYYAGWADKVGGKTIETNESKFSYTRREPYGVVGNIVPWNLPLLLLCNKLAPALAAGNTVVVKPSEITPLTALKFAEIINQAGFPPGVVNIVNGYGNTVGNAMSHHKDISLISFTGSTIVGRKIQEAAAKSNLKVVHLELGGKSPNIIFDDAGLEQAVKWSSSGIFFNMGQACVAGSRIFVQAGIYDKFIEGMTKVAQNMDSRTGDPFEEKTRHGPQVSQMQFDRVMGYINSAKTDGATIHVGGEQHDKGGYFVQPTIITDVTPDMKVVKEEIFGPVASVIKFETEEEVIEMANNTTYGLACGVFTENNSRAIRVAHALEAGMAFAKVQVPFGGYKQSGFGREWGQEGIEEYMQVKAVHVNLGLKI